MRKLPLLLALLLLSVLLGAASAQASLLPVPAPVQPFVTVDEEEAEEDEAEEDEEEFCTLEEEEEELCEEEPAPKGKDKAEGEECLLKSAKAAITANPGKQRLRLTVHYRTLKPTTVNVEASLQGPKGTVRLGSEHARFRRSGVYRDTFSLPEKQAKKALAAREFLVELHVVNAPSSCDVELTGNSGGARKLGRS
ncbi:MAG TPA: hypothetical protein VLI94_13560 [Solirubrobacterales bacterium]|nr:hypothetical protein [Solirubrobacterales bacterium]